MLDALLTPGAFSALIQVLMIDLVLAGDNAVAVGVVAAGLPAADRKRVIDVLNSVLAAELVCVLRYKRHFFTAQGLNAAPVAAEFKQHADEEQGHADLVAERIVVGGEPDSAPRRILRGDA